VTLATSLATAIRLLEQAAVPYMLTGSVASASHGEPRSTLHIDIVIDPDVATLERLVEALEAGGFYVDRDAALGALRERAQFNAIGTDAVKVDFIIRRNRPFSVEEFGRRHEVQLPGSAGYMATAEDLIVAKLEWAVATDSERQLRDVAGILAVAGNTLDQTYLSHWIVALGLTDAWERVVSREAHNEPLG
jgi:hypothetical protein